MCSGYTSARLFIFSRQTGRCIEHYTRTLVKKTFSISNCNCGELAEYVTEADQIRLKLDHRCAALHKSGVRLTLNDMF